MSSVKVRDVMSDVPLTIDAESSFREAVRRLMFHGISGLPVVDRDEHLIGIVSEADLMRKEACDPLIVAHGGGLLKHLRAFLHAEIHQGRGETTTVGDVMTTDVVTTSPDERLHAAARRMAKAGHRRMPVIDEDGRVVGILSRHDVLEVFDRSDDELERAVREILDRSLYVAPDAEIRLEVSDGKITLQGMVRFESDVRVAGSIVSSVDGVIDVDNRLTFRTADPQLRAAG